MRAAASPSVLGEVLDGGQASEMRGFVVIKEETSYKPERSVKIHAGYRYRSVDDSNELILQRS